TKDMGKTGVNFFSPLVLNRVDPTRIAMGGTGAYVTQDTYPSNAAIIDLTLVKVGDAGGNVTSIAYGSGDDANALVVGALASSGAALLWRSLTADAGMLQPLPAYANAGGGAPTGIVFDARTAQHVFVADGVNLWSTQNGAAPAAASVTFQ